MTDEERRLKESRERKSHWKRWGPYLSERQWGTVREDYSPDGSAWDYFPHDHARSRAYRWGEDGIAGISDRHQILCFAIALWNGKDPILKERLFGLTGPQGNHGEDVKEYYFYLDSTPTHSYMKALYKYPHAEYPYSLLVSEGTQRARQDPELELIDTGVFSENRYFDVYVEYAKADVEDVLIRITVANRGPETAELDLLPTIWFRNTWSWGIDERRPRLTAFDGADVTAIKTRHFHEPGKWLVCEGTPQLLFTGNETNYQKLFGTENHVTFVKDGINDFVVNGRTDAINPSRAGTKASARYHLSIGAGETREVRLRLTGNDASAKMLGHEFEDVFKHRIAEADEFYRKFAPVAGSSDLKLVQRQSFAGLLWSKQFYHYNVRRWLRGDPAGPEPPQQRKLGRNHQWGHLYNDDVLSMPDKWEYPWFAAWDLAFHCIPLALVDPDFAKQQLILLLREWYMHPNGQLPAYEWNFEDVNPPVHAWAAWRVYKIEQRHHGSGDRKFLARVFHKLLLNFTWWVNRKDTEGNNVFEGGFLGLDNIGVFDRSAKLQSGNYLEQSDATSWMGMFCLNMMVIALELAKYDSSYEDVASKFFEHFVLISRAMNNIAGKGIELWDSQDGFYYDVLHLQGGKSVRMRVRSLVGLIPIFAVESLDSDLLDKLPGFKRRMQWFIDNAPEFSEYVETTSEGSDVKRVLALVNRGRLRRVLRYMFDENEFLSPHGIRSVSKFHKEHPYKIQLGGADYGVDYEPGESMTGLFGGNSNWRGPIWFPVNFLIIESLQKYHHFLGDDFKVEFPTGSGHLMNLWDISIELGRRLVRIFMRDGIGERPVHGKCQVFQNDPYWKDLILFYEYFHGDDGSGLGASHQTGWTGLVSKLIMQAGSLDRPRVTSLLDSQAIA